MSKRYTVCRYCKCFIDLYLSPDDKFRRGKPSQPRAQGNRSTVCYECDEDNQHGQVKHQWERPTEEI